MDRFWNIFLPILFLMTFAVQIIQGSYETALWVFIAAGWYGINRLTEIELSHVKRENGDIYS